jgi:tetratricopeptide (TPR) repeat protein
MRSKKCPAGTGRVEMVEIPRALGSHALGLLATVLALVLSAGQGARASEGGADAAEAETRRAACAFQAGDYAAARRHAERALDFSPAGARLAVLAARMVVRQYEAVVRGVDEGIEGAEGGRLAREAIAAYAKVLAFDPGSYEAALYTARLYAWLGMRTDALAAVAAYEEAVPFEVDDLGRVGNVADLYLEAGESGRAREVLLKHAASETAPRKTRAQAYYRAAVLDWACASDILRKHETRGPRPNRPPVYRTKEPAVRRRARACAQRAMEMLERSLALDTASAAWAYKRVLFTLEPKLRQLEGRPTKAALFEAKAREAEQMYLKLQAAEMKRAAAMEGVEAQRETSPVWRVREDPYQTGAKIAEFVRTGTLRRRGSADVMALTDPLSLAELVAAAPPPPPPGEESEGERLERERRAREARRRQKLPVIRFSPEGEEFTVEMPSPVTASGSPVFRFYSASSESVDYTVVSRPLPEPPPGASPSDVSLVIGTLVLAGLEAVHDSLDEYYEFEAAFVRDASAAGMPGKLYRFRASQYCGDTAGALLVYVSPERVYTLLVRGADDGDPRARAFLESFRPGPAPDGAGE